MPRTQEGRGPGPAPGTPVWVKVFGIVALVLILLIAALLLAGGGSHGPGRHTQSSNGYESALGDAAMQQGYLDDTVHNASHPSIAPEPEKALQQTGQFHGAWMPVGSCDGRAGVHHQATIV